MSYSVDYLYHKLFSRLIFEADFTDQDIQKNGDKLKKSGDLDYSLGYLEGLKRAIQLLNNTHYHLNFIHKEDKK